MFWNCNLDILLSACKLFKSSELDNSLVNFRFYNNDFFARNGIKISSDDAIFLKLNSMF